MKSTLSLIESKCHILHFIHDKVEKSNPRYGKKQMKIKISLPFEEIDALKRKLKPEKTTSSTMTDLFQ
jgi:hypothetical protein